MSDIFGYAWSDIQRAQQGGRLGRAVDTSVPVSSAPTEEDRALLAQHGGSLDALEAAGMYGAADAFGGIRKRESHGYGKRQ
jgi:hypothetical protein